MRAISKICLTLLSAWNISLLHLKLSNSNAFNATFWVFVCGNSRRRPWTLNVIGDLHSYGSMTQHASLPPAFPVFRLPSSPAFPKSSSPACTCNQNIFSSYAVEHFSGGSRISHAERANPWWRTKTYFCQKTGRTWKKFDPKELGACL